MSYNEALLQYGSFRKAAKVFGISKTQFVKLYKKELGLCTRRTSCLNPPEPGKASCKEHLEYAKRTTDKNRVKNYNKLYKEKNRKILNEKRREWYYRNYNKQREYHNSRNSLPKVKEYARLKNHIRRGDLFARDFIIKSCFDKFNNQCFKCGSLNNLELDHHIPLSKGGLLRKDNTVILCKSCNSKKHAATPEEFYSKKELKILESLLFDKLERVVSEQDLLKEFLHFENIKPRIDALPFNNKITTYFNPHFYEVEKELWKDDSIKTKIIQNRCKYLNKTVNELNSNEILRGFKISGIYIGFSHHSPFWIKAFINKYKINSIYDPCGGWGHRLLGASNIQYIYNDLDIRSCKGAENIIAYFKLKNKKVYNEDASLFTPTEDYEAVFTCPPYFDTEIYTSANTSTSLFPEYNEWLNNFWRNLIKKSIKTTTKYFAFIINNKYLEDMKEVCLEENLILLEIVQVGKSMISHLNKGRETNKSEYLLIFKTPNT